MPIKRIGPDPDKALMLDKAQIEVVNSLAQDLAKLLPSKSRLLEAYGLTQSEAIQTMSGLMMKIAIKSLLTAKIKVEKAEPSYQDFIHLCDQMWATELAEFAKENTPTPPAKPTPVPANEGD